MAQLNSLIVTGNSRFINPINGNARNGVYYVKGTQTAATGAWTGNIPVPALYDGLTIMYYLPYAGSGNATLNLTLSTGATTGAINCYYSTSRLTTHYAKGSNIVMTYHPAGSISVDGTATTDNRWIANANYTDGNSVAYLVTNYYNSFKAGANKVFPYTIIMQCSDGRWESIVTSSSTGTSKARNTHGFRLGQIALMYANATYAENATIGANTIYEEKSDLIDHRYSFNTANDATNGTTAVKPVYLVGTVNATDGLFYLDTTWWTQTLPSTADGKVYIYLGDAFDYYRMSFTIHHPIYCYTNGMIRQFAQDCATVNGVDINTKMDKVNPTGSGYFSLNRKAGTTIGSYSFAEGYGTQATGSYSHAEGGGAKAIGDGSHAEGAGTQANGIYSHAEGTGSQANGDISHAEGYNTTASAIGSHAENISTADGQYSHSEGYSTTKGQYSHAEGNSTTSSGVSSHSEGNGTVASGANSHAEGYGTIAAGNYQHVSGTFNITDEDDIYAEIIGNGTYNARSNARTLDWSGNEVLSGTIDATGFGTTLLNLIYPVGSIYMSVNNINPGTYLTGTTWEEWGTGRVPVGVDTKQTEFEFIEKTGGEKTHLLTGTESGLPTHYHNIPSLSGTAAATTNLTGDAYFHGGEVASILYNCSGVFSNSYGGSTTQYRTPGDLTARSGAASKGIIHFAGNHSHTVTTNSSLTEKVYDTDAEDAHNNLQPYITCYMWKRTA